jgi:hypothetical protein
LILWQLNQRFCHCRIDSFSKGLKNYFFKCSEK